MQYRENASAMQVQLHGPCIRSKKYAVNSMKRAEVGRGERVGVMYMQVGQNAIRSVNKATINNHKTRVHAIGHAHASEPQFK